MPASLSLYSLARRAFGAGVLLASACSPALAWGPEGHEIVARIAAHELTPAARGSVEDLLGAPADDAMAKVSSWPDWQGRERSETKPWHYVNIEMESAGYDALRDCPAEACVVAQIDRDMAILRDAGAPRAARVEALVWLIHLVGDVHQPLHAGDRHDRGGHTVAVLLDGKRSDLHKLWDGLPTRFFGPWHGREAADALDRKIGARDRAGWDRGTPADWANECFVIARDDIYAKLPVTEPFAPDDAALAAERPVVEQQLEKAGSRLAWLLDQAFDQNSRP
jgi:hypothetical protein